MRRTGASLVVVVLFLSLVSSGRPVSSQVDQCLSHFEESGSVFKGKILETYEEFAGIDVTTAIRRLQEQLPGAGVAIVSVNAEQGVIKGENQAPNSRPFPINLTVASHPSGVRVGLWLKMNAGQMVVGGTKPALCELIRLASVEPPPPPPPPKPPEPTLTNAAVVALVQAGLDEEIIAAKIKQSPRAELDVSTDALVELKRLNVSKAVVSAMLARAGGEASSATNSQLTGTSGSPAVRQAPAPKPISEELRLAKPLSRAAAKGLIAASKEGTAKQYEMFFLGVDFRQSDYIGFGNWQFLDALARTGYVQRQGNRWVLTAKGNSVATAWQRDPGRPDARLVPVATREIASVTGITEAELGQGTVAEFTWVWRPTAIAGELGRVEVRIAQKYGPEEHSGSALFKYYDDGWRIQEIEW